MTAARVSSARPSPFSSSPSSAWPRTSCSAACSTARGARRARPWIRSGTTVGPERARSDRGAGLFSTSFGILFFLGFLLFAVQLLFNLYATSVVTSATYDAARQVATEASHPATPEQLAAAEDHAPELLGRCGQAAAFSRDLSDPDVIKLRVVVENPRVLSRTLASAVGFDTIDRTVTVRIEELR